MSNTELTLRLSGAPQKRAWSLEIPQDFKEPRDREGYDAFEPTPVYNLRNPYYDQIKPHQERVDGAIQELLEKGAPELPQVVRDLAILNHRKGDAVRAEKMFHAYFNWYGTDGEVAKTELTTKQLSDEHYGLLVGTNRPHETLHFLKNTTLEAAELAKISHPFGFRQEHVAGALSAVEQGLIDNGGELFQCKRPRYHKIELQPVMDDPESDQIIWDNEGDEDNRVVDYKELGARLHGTQKVEPQRCELKGFLIVYKESIGCVERADGRHIVVTGRRTAALRIDDALPSTNTVYKHAGRKISYDDLAFTLRQPYTIPPVDGDWQRHLARIDEFMGYSHFFRSIIQDDDNTSDFPAFVPLSTMYYAAAETEQAYADRIQAEQKRTAHLAQTALR